MTFPVHSSIIPHTLLIFLYSLIVCLRFTFLQTLLVTHPLLFIFIFIFTLILNYYRSHWIITIVLLHSNYTYYRPKSKHTSSQSYPIQALCHFCVTLLQIECNHPSYILDAAIFHFISYVTIITDSTCSNFWIVLLPVLTISQTCDTHNTTTILVLL